MSTLFHPSTSGLFERSLLQDSFALAGGKCVMEGVGKAVLFLLAHKVSGEKVGLKNVFIFLSAVCPKILFGTVY